MNKTARSWLITVVVVGLLVGVIAAFGGFQRASTDLEPALPIGEPVDTGRWMVSVQRATLSDVDARDGFDIDPVVRVWMNVTNLDTRYSYGLSEDAIAFLGPHGRIDTEGLPYMQRVGSGPGDIGPRLSREVYFDFPIGTQEWAEGDIVRVALGYEQYGSGGYSATEAWNYTHMVGVVHVPVEDERR